MTVDELAEELSRSGMSFPLAPKSADEGSWHDFRKLVASGLLARLTVEPKGPIGG